MKGDYKMADRVLMTKVYPIIKKNLSQPSNKKIIQDVCRGYLERNKLWLDQ